MSKKPGLFRRIFGGDDTASAAVAEEAARNGDAAETAAAQPEPAVEEQPEVETIAPEAIETVEDDLRQMVEAEEDVPFPEPLLPEPEIAPSEAPRRGWFSRLRDGLSKSSNALSEGIANIVSRRKLDDETIQDLEDVLIQADLGVETATRITETLAASRYDKQIAPEEVRAVLAAEVGRVLEPVARPLEIGKGKPHVILVVGVNGSGKTTTIGKLAQKFARDGRKVMLAAGDTFRAAAIEQLKIWGERSGAPVVAGNTGADASGLAFDAMARARQEGSDVLLIDTAGRLQNKTDLMAELEKVIRVIGKQDPEAPHSVLLVLDATTGQNALTQAEIFTKIAGVTGIVMTKLDGTARGGILVAIAAKYALPVHFIGVGEGIDDLQPFEADEFAEAIAGLAGE
ncbi:MAG: signal recognition particle-docking protein FtsY [Rhodobiaceae bacterium]|nr:signal recognition particle-docking protein FtsY [Rhodobiaceae bacterium]MCC0055541.1 signal recognition particle-docking protein FtsY [Rhodobiaceae bacterium]